MEWPRKSAWSTKTGFRKRTRWMFSRSHPSPARLLCVLCALSRLNFGIRVQTRKAKLGIRSETRHLVSYRSRAARPAERDALFHHRLPNIVPFVCFACFAGNPSESGFMPAQYRRTRVSPRRSRSEIPGPRPISVPVKTSDTAPARPVFNVMVPSSEACNARNKSLA